jgi:hypothetical protein
VKKFTIGQILFVLSVKKMQLIPVMVTEETSKKTVDGETITYKVISTDKCTYTLDESFSDKIYDSLDDVKNILIEKSMQKIDSLIEQTMLITKENFNYLNDNEVLISAGTN